jgi:tetratricopeptide (TPR) repeat protein
MNKQIIKYIPVILIGLLVVIGCQKRIEQIYDKGYSQYITGDFKGAIESFTKYIESNNNAKYKNVSIYLRSICYIQTKENKLALADLNNLIEHSLKSEYLIGNYYYTRSFCYTELKNYKEALVDINKALKYNVPNEFRQEIILQRAKIKYATGDFIGARVDSFVVIKNYVRKTKTFDNFRLALQKNKIN